jgi:hypothetical protein
MDVKRVRAVMQVRCRVKFADVQLRVNNNVAMLN